MAVVWVVEGKQRGREADTEGEGKQTRKRWQKSIQMAAW